MENTLLLDALARINRIGAAMNSTGSGGSYATVLRMVVDSIVEVAPGTAAAIYIRDEARGEFDLSSRVAAGRDSEDIADAPRAGGLGQRAVERRSILSSTSEPGATIHPARAAGGAVVTACFPLVFAGDALGVLYLHGYDRPDFLPVEMQAAEAFANLAAVTLSLARQAAQAQQEQLRKDRELRRLRRAGMLISSRSSLKATLDTILQVALEVTDAIYGIFRLVDRSGKNLVTQAISGVGLEKPAVETLEINGNSIMGTVALKREPIIISDLREGPWKGIYYPFDLELEMRSELAVPLIGASGRLEGVLNLESPAVNAFDRQDRYILQILATQAVVAIQEARLLDTLQEISALLSGQPSEIVFQRLVEQACDLLNVPAGIIWLQEKNNLVMQASVNSAYRGLRIPLEGTLTAQVIEQGRPHTVLNAGQPGLDEPRAYPDLPGFGARGAALIVPLFSSDNVALGAFSVYTGQADPRNFEQSDWDKKVLDILGHYAALALQSAAQRDALRVAEEQRATTEAFAAIGDIAANLLHRLNNKIGTIPVRVEGIQDKCGEAISGDPYLEKNLVEIERSASEAMQVVRESLFHLHPIQLAPVSVAGSVHEALVTTRLPAGVKVVSEGLDYLPPVQAGPRRLGLVFANLLENASDAMGGSGQIKIWGVAAGGRVEVRVADTGPGIPPELHEKVFEFNYSSRASSQPGKLGFGLWWVKSLMARFGGTVSIASDGKHGTTFILSLPQAREESWQTD